MWTDESKQQAMARSSPPAPRSLFRKRGAGESFVEMVDRKVRKAARNGPRSFSVEEFGRLLTSEDSDSDSSCGASVGFPGEETQSEKEERKTLENELRNLAEEEQRGWQLS